MSLMTVTNSRRVVESFLHCDVSFSFVTDMCIKVTSVDVDTFGRIVVLLGQGVEEIFNCTSTRAHIHAINVVYAHYQGRCNRPGYGLV